MQPNRSHFGMSRPRIAVLLLSAAFLFASLWLLPLPEAGRQRPEAEGSGR